MGVFIHSGPFHDRRAKRDQARGVHGNVPLILAPRQSGPRLRPPRRRRNLLAAPLSRMAGRTVRLHRRGVEERIGFFLPTPEDVNVAHVVLRNCGAHRFQSWSLVGPRVARTCKETQHERAARGPT